MLLAKAYQNYQGAGHKFFVPESQVELVPPTVLEQVDQLVLEDSAVDGDGTFIGLDTVNKEILQDVEGLGATGVSQTGDKQQKVVEMEFINDDTVLGQPKSSNKEAGPMEFINTPDPKAQASTSNPNPSDTSKPSTSTAPSQNKEQIDLSREISKLSSAERDMILADLLNLINWDFMRREDAEATFFTYVSGICKTYNDTVKDIGDALQSINFRFETLETDIKDMRARMANMNTVIDEFYRRSGLRKDITSSDVEAPEVSTDPKDELQKGVPADHHNVKVILNRLSSDGYTFFEETPEIFHTLINTYDHNVLIECLSAYKLDVEARDMTKLLRSNLYNLDGAKAVYDILSKAAAKRTVLETTDWRSDPIPFSFNAIQEPTKSQQAPSKAPETDCAIFQRLEAMKLKGAIPKYKTAEEMAALSKQRSNKKPEDKVSGKDLKKYFRK